MALRILLSLFLPVILLTGCSENAKRSPKVDSLRSNKPVVAEVLDVKYSEQQLEAFLDSVGKLPTQPLADKVAFSIDSVFRHPRLIDRMLSSRDFKVLEKAIRLGSIDTAIAKQIFTGLKIDTACEARPDSLIVIFHSFDKKKSDMNEYAIELKPSGCWGGHGLYFFKKNKLIMELGLWRNDDGPEHYTDVDGKTVIYQRMCFDRGSGIWWYNWFFYKYDGDRLLPVLNELQSGNMQGRWGLREKLLDADILSTQPLTIKMVYEDHFPDTAEIDYGPALINDSTIVKYKWNERTRMLEGQYDNSKISKAQVLTYYLNDNELLFIKVNNEKLKRSLRDKAMRPKVFRYLNDVKNYLNRRKVAN